MKVQPYLFFNGRAEEALEFYKKTLGVQQQMLMRFSENPEPPQPGMVPPGSENKIMHMCFSVGETLVMGSDGRNTGTPNFQGFCLSINPKDEAAAKKLFDALGEGGKVEMPLGKTFYAKCLGMVTDKFGVCWMINVEV